MNERDFDRVARAFMAEGPTQLADRVLDSSLADVHFTRQRRVLVRAPWRTPVMNIYAKVAAAAVVIVAVGALGIALLRPDASSPSVGGPAPSVAPSKSPTQPSAAPTSGAGAPLLSETFTSTLYGMSLSYPDGWTAQPGTQPWAAGEGLVSFGAPYSDVVYDPTLGDNLFLQFASQPLGDTAPDAWTADALTLMECSTSAPITVDGASGLIGEEGCDRAAVTVGGRGYAILLYTGDSAPAYDRAWFEEVLATVQLHPEDAVASVESSPDSFTSTQNGISLATPAGWTKQPATEPGPEAWPGGWITFGDPYADFIYDPVKQGNLWLGIDSVPLNAADADAWPNAQISVTECPIAVPVTIDGALGYTGFEFQSTECSVAFVNLGDRGYQIRLYASDDAAVYDRAWFDEVLATVKLHPSDAVD